MRIEERQALLKEFEKELRSNVGPVVEKAGFDWAEGNLFGDSNEFQALFEAFPDPYAVAEKLPHLEWPEWRRDKEGCVDLWIFLDPRTFSIWADVETSDVSEWLVKHRHAKAADELTNAPDLASAVRSLARGLDLMFTGTGRG